MGIFKNYKILDIILSICWFLMDFSWFLEIRSVGFIFGVIGFLFAVALYFKPYDKESLANKANLFWFLMNFNWFMHDMSKDVWTFVVSCFFFALGALSIVIYLITSIKEHGEIKNPLKRLK